METQIYVSNISYVKTTKSPDEANWERTENEETDGDQFRKIS